MRLEFLTKPLRRHALQDAIPSPGASGHCSLTKALRHVKPLALDSGPALFMNVVPSGIKLSCSARSCRAEERQTACSNLKKGIGTLHVLVNNAGTNKRIPIFLFPRKTRRKPSRFA